MLEAETSESSPDWKALSRQAQKPVIFNYMVCPHVPEGAETILSPEGEPFMLNYSELDWKMLASELQKPLEGSGYPKSIKIYVGNDAIDLFDMNRFCAETCSEADDYYPFSRAIECFSKAKMSNYRAGVVRIPETSEGLHLNPSTTGKRPPICALFVSIRFGTMSQVVDYLSTVSQIIFGLPDSTIKPGKRDAVLGTCAVPEPLAQWLRVEAGAVYDSDYTIIRLPTTMSEN